jgi:hypothetical protein
MEKILAIGSFLFFFFSAHAQNYRFAKGVGGTSFENAMGIAIDSSGNIIVSGYFSGICDFDPSASIQALNSNGSNDIFLAKYDSAGNYIWAMQIGGVNDEFTYADPVVNSNGDIYICGVFNAGTEFNPLGNSIILGNNGLNDGFIAKYNSAGLLQWAKNFGGADDDDVYHIALNSNQDILFAGYFSGTADLDPGIAYLPFISSSGGDCYFGKLNANGNLIWVQALSASSDDRSFNIASNSLNDIFISGTFSDTLFFHSPFGSDTLINSNQSAFVAAFQDNGTFIKAFAMSSTLPFGLHLDRYNNLLLCGQFSGNVDFDPSPNFSFLYSQAGSPDIFLAKYSPSMQFLFAHRFGGNGSDMGYAVQEMADSSIVLTGYFFQTADFDPGPGNAFLTSAGFGDLFIARYNPQGNYINSFRCGSSGFDFVRNISTDIHGNIFVAGGFENTVDFDPSSAIYTLSSAGSRDGFFASYGLQLTGQQQLFSAALMPVVYPVPFANTLNIQLETNEPVRVLLTDIAGRIIFERSQQSGNLQIQTQACQSGMYLLTLQTKENSITKKVMKH